MCYAKHMCFNIAAKEQILKWEHWNRYASCLVCVTEDTIDVCVWYLVIERHVVHSDC